MQVCGTRNSHTIVYSHFCIWISRETCTFIVLQAKIILLRNVRCSGHPSQVNCHGFWRKIEPCFNIKLCCYSILGILIIYKMARSAVHVVLWLSELGASVGIREWWVQFSFWELFFPQNFRVSPAGKERSWSASPLRVKRRRLLCWTERSQPLYSWSSTLPQLGHFSERC
jgi:hypothetical protein